MTDEQAERLIKALNRNAIALENHEDTLNRAIQKDSKLHGVLTRSEEMRALKKERASTIKGTEKSNQQVLKLLGRTG